MSEYFRELIRERQRRQAAPATPTRVVDRQRALEAVRTILELQQKLSLKGLSVEDLIGEGRDA